MTGEQWLDQVFRPAVAVAARRERDADVVTLDPLRVLGGRLAAQLEALAATGVLTEEQERVALAALDEAGITPQIRTVTTSTSSTSTVGRAADRPPALLGLLAGPRPLGLLHGRPVTLVSAELWSDRFLVDLFTDPGPDHRDRRMRASRERMEWIRQQRHGRTTERPRSGFVPSPLQELTWRLRDEHGTSYHRSGGSAESTDHLDRQRIQWSPAPNADALALRATDATGTPVFEAEIPVPLPAT